MNLVKSNQVWIVFRFPIDLAPKGIPFDAKSFVKVKSAIIIPIWFELT